jgi:hypothetical protein
MFCHSFAISDLSLHLSLTFSHMPNSSLQMREEDEHFLISAVSLLAVDYQPYWVVLFSALRGPGSVLEQFMSDLWWTEL